MIGFNARQWIAVLVSGALTNALQAQRTDLSVEETKARLVEYHDRVVGFRCTFVRIVVGGPPADGSGEKTVKVECESLFDREGRRARVDEKAITSTGRIFRSLTIVNGDECFYVNYPDGKEIISVIRTFADSSRIAGLRTPENLLGFGFHQYSLGNLIAKHELKVARGEASKGAETLKCTFSKSVDNRPTYRTYWMDPTRQMTPCAGEFGGAAEEKPRMEFTVLAWGKAKDVALNSEVAMPEVIKVVQNLPGGRVEEVNIQEISAEVNGRLPDDAFEFDLKKLPPGVEVQDRIKQKSGLIKGDAAAYRERFKRVYGRDPMAQAAEVKSGSAPINVDPPRPQSIITTGAAVASVALLLFGIFLLVQRRMRR